MGKKTTEKSPFAVEDEGLWLCDVCNNPDASFSFTVTTTKLLRTLMLDCHKIQQSTCHLKIFENQVRIRVVSSDDIISLEAEIPRTVFPGPWKPKIPLRKKGEYFSGLIAHFDFEILANDLPNTAKSSTVTIRKSSKKLKELEFYFDDQSGIAKSIPLYPAKPAAFDNETWDTDYMDPTIVVQSGFLKLNKIFTGNKGSDLQIDLFTKGILFTKTEGGRKHPIPIGVIPQDNDGFVDATNELITMMTVSSALFNPIGDLITKTNENGTVCFYINNDYTHFKMLIKVGVLCEVVVQIDSPAKYENDEENGNE